MAYRIFTSTKSRKDMRAYLRYEADRRGVSAREIYDEEMAYSKDIQQLGITDEFLANAVKKSRQIAVTVFTVVALILTITGCVAPYVPVTPPAPVPHPPAPVFPDVPTPQPTPIVSGQRVVIIVHETAEQSPAFSRMRNDLAAGDQAKWFDKKNHVLAILDKDDVGPDKQRLKVLDYIEPSYKGKKLPVLVICEKTGEKVGRVLSVEELRPDATADNVVELVTRSGG